MLALYIILETKTYLVNNQVLPRTGRHS